jgi:hypothetical protein
LKGQSRLNNSETLAKLGTQGQRQTKQKSQHMKQNDEQPGHPSKIPGMMAGVGEG